MKKVLMLVTMFTLLTVGTVSVSNALVVKTDPNEMTLQLKCVGGFLFAIANIGNNLQLTQVYEPGNRGTRPVKCDQWNP